MITIYINNRPLRFCAAPAPLAEADEPRHLTTNWTGEAAVLSHYADVLAQADCPYTAISIVGDAEKMMKIFAKAYKIIPAAGGVIANAQGQILLIHRRGFWDLPKGKIDDGEQTDAAALREVAEEVGLTECVIIAPLCTTYHTYDWKGKNVLKPTFWFAMTTPNTDVTLQTEEDITASQWTDLKQFMATGELIYPNIKAVLEEYERTQ